MRQRIKIYYERGKQFSRRRPVCSFLIAYTILFLFIFAVISLAFLRQKKLFLGLGDGPDQLYPAFYYTGQWLKELFSNLFHGDFVLPMYAFDMGMGSDIITTLHYYAIGDPFSLLTLFCPQSYMEILYYFVIYAKFYCIGLAFFAYAHYMKIGWYEGLLGSLLYTFSTFSIVFFLPMGIFGNAIICLPLLCLGLEKIFRGDKPHLFVGMVCVSILSNFYFFYMLTILIFLYGVIRYFFAYRTKRISHFLKTFGKTAGFYCIGIAMGAVLFLPMVYAFLNSCRAGSVSFSEIGMFYSNEYYKTFFASYMTVDAGSNYTALAFSAISVFAIIYLFTHKGRSFWQMRVGYLLLTAAMLLPVFGWVFNGFGYPVNRWMFGYVFIICIITAVILPKLYQSSRKTLLLLSAFLFLYFIGCTLLYSNSGGWGNASAYTFIGLCIGAFLLCVLSYFRKSQSTVPVKAGILFCTCVFIAINGFMIYDLHYIGNVAGYQQVTATKNLYQNSLGATAENLPQSGSFSRAATDGKTLANDSMLHGYHSYPSYWSIQNQSAFELYKDQDIGLHFVHYYPDFGYDPYLLALTSSEYFLTSPENQNPLFDYEQIETPAGCPGAVYQNQNPLPLAFTYDNYISREDYDQLSTMEKKRILLRSLVLENGSGVLKPHDTIMELPPAEYTVKSSENVTASEHTIELRNGESNFSLQVDIPKGRTVYLAFENLQFSYTSWFTVTCGNNVQSVHYLNSDFLYYYDNHDYLISLGKNDEDVDSILINCGVGGTLTFDAIHVYIDDLTEFTETISARRADSIQNLVTGDNRVSADITVDQPKSLFFSIPYSEGWTAKVNSKDVAIEKANVAFLSVPLEQGANHVELFYRTPWLVPGALITLVAVAGYVGISVILRMRRKGRNGKAE